MIAPRETIRKRGAGRKMTTAGRYALRLGVRKREIECLGGFEYLRSLAPYVRKTLLRRMKNQKPLSKLKDEATSRKSALEAKP